MDCIRKRWRAYCDGLSGIYVQIDRVAFLVASVWIDSRMDWSFVVSFERSFLWMDDIFTINDFWDFSFDSFSFRVFLAFWAGGFNCRPSKTKKNVIVSSFL